MIKRFDVGGTTGTGTYVDPLAGKQTGTESSLSNWVGPYVTDMLGKGQALAQTPYTAYTGPLTAGPSALQDTAFSGLANLTLPTEAQTTYTPKSFTGAGYTPLSAADLAAGKTPQYMQASDDVVKQYMSPYLMASLQPQIDEARRQAEIQRIQDAGRLTRAGAYGGSRQAVMESEGARNLMTNLANITGKGYQDAFTAAQNQFNIEQARQQSAAQQAQQYGLSALGAQLGAGATQRDIEQQGVAADIAQFQEERDYPYKQLQYMQSLLQGLPVAAQSATYQQPTGLNTLLGGAGGILGLLQQMNIIPKPGGSSTPAQPTNYTYVPTSSAPLIQPVDTGSATTYANMS